MSKAQQYEDEIKRILKETAKKIDEKKEKEIRNNVPEKLEAINGKSSFLKELIERVKLLYEMITDPEYKIRKEHKLIFLAALLYFLIPIDLVADYIPVLGMLDDAMVFKVVWKTYQDEIQNYMQFVNLKKETSKDKNSSLNEDMKGRKA